MALKRLLLVDVNPLLYRVAYASVGKENPWELSVEIEGKQMKTTVLQGFCQNILSTLEEVKPTHVCLAKDWKPTIDGKRCTKYPMYKSNRNGKKMKDSEKPEVQALDKEVNFLWDVMPKLMKDGFGVETIESQGHEADDVIGTFTQQALRDNFEEVVIVSNDNDFVQLLPFSDIYSGNVKIWTTNKEHPKWQEKTLQNPGTQFERFNIKLDQFLDFRALSGDQTDSIPGCTSVGPKRAKQLLDRYGDLQTVLREAPNMNKSKMRDNLIQETDMIWLYRELVELEKNIEILKASTDFPAFLDEEGEIEMCEARRKAYADAPNKTLADLEVQPRTKEEASAPFRQYHFDFLMQRIQNSDIFQDANVV